MRPKLVTVTILTILLCVTAGAAADIDFGIRAGINTAMMTGDGLDDFDGDPANAFTFGAFANFKLNDNMQFQPELMISRRGVNKRYSTSIFRGFIDFEESIGLTYIEIPLLFKFPVPSADEIKPALYLGPAIALNVSATCSGEYFVTGSNAISNGSYDGDITNTEAFDLGLVIGGDLIFRVAGHNVVLDLRYTSGLRKVFSDMDYPIEFADGDIPMVDISTGEGPELTNNAFSLSIGILF